MEIDVDTFLTTIYCHIDDLYQERFAPHKPVRPGREPEVSDSEVLTIAILCQWQEHSSERAFLRYVRRHWRHYFPRVLSQSAFNRRVRDLPQVLTALGPALAERLSASLRPQPVYQVLDGVPVPLMRRYRGERHRVFGSEASVGRGGTGHRWYYGVRLVSLVDNQGCITGFVIGPAATAEHWLADALLRWRSDPEGPVPSVDELDPILGPNKTKEGRRGPTGPIASRYGAGTWQELPILGDLGFKGIAWQGHWVVHYGATVFTEQDYQDLPQQERLADWLHAHRQVIETVHSVLDSLLHLPCPGARTFPGLLARIGAKVAALNLLVTLNRQVGRGNFEHFSPLA
jgi:hypothetical protein